MTKTDKGGKAVGADGEKEQEMGKPPLNAVSAAHNDDGEQVALAGEKEEGSPSASEVEREEEHDGVTSGKKEPGKPTSSAVIAAPNDDGEKVGVPGEKEQGSPSAPEAESVAPGVDYEETGKPASSAVIAAPNDDGEQVAVPGKKKEGGPSAEAESVVPVDDEEPGKPPSSAVIAAPNEDGEKVVVPGKKEEGSPSASEAVSVAPVDDEEKHHGVTSGNKEGPQAADPTPKARCRQSDAVAEFLRTASQRQREAPGVEVRETVQLSEGTLLRISAGSVIDFGGGTEWPPETSASVNAANTGGLSGGGVDGAFVSAGGDALRRDRRALPVLGGGGYGGGGDRIRTGGAVATGPNRYGRLHVGTVIHAVGPIYDSYGDFEEPDQLLADAYAKTMRLAEDLKIQYLGVCLLSAGIFRGSRSLDAVLGVAVKTVASNAYPGLKEVHLIGFTQEEIDTLLHHARTWGNKSHVDESYECKAQSRPVEGGTPSTGCTEAKCEGAAEEQEAGALDAREGALPAPAPAVHVEENSSDEEEGRCFPRLCRCFYARLAQAAGANGRT